MQGMLMAAGRSLNAGLDQLAEAYFCSSRSRVRTRKKYAGGYNTFPFCHHRFRSFLVSY